MKTKQKKTADRLALKALWFALAGMVTLTAPMYAEEVATTAAVSPTLASQRVNAVENVVFAPVKVIHEGVNRTLPMATVWDSLDRVHGLAAKDWLGDRHYLEQYGLTFNAVYTGDFVANSGGIEGGATYLGNLDLTLSLDTEKAGLWKGGTLMVYGVENHGGQPSAKYVGDKQGVSNIEASQDTFRLFEL